MKVRFSKLLEFEGGPMYRVFTEDEIELWREWTLSRAGDCWARMKFVHWAEWLEEQVPPTGQDKKEKQAGKSERQKKLEKAGRSNRVWKLIDQLRAAASDRRVEIWLEIAKWKTHQSQDPIDLEAFLLEERLKPWLASSMARVVTTLAPQQADSSCHEAAELPDPGSGKKASVTWWFEQVLDGSGSDLAVKRLMQALAESPLIEKGDPDSSDFVKELIPLPKEGPYRPMAKAFSRVIPGNDGHRASQTTKLWIEHGCPLPEVKQGRNKPPSPDPTVDEEERHPTGLLLGMGCTH